MSHNIYLLSNLLPHSNSVLLLEMSLASICTEVSIWSNISVFTNPVLLKIWLRLNDELFNLLSCVRVSGWVTKEVMFWEELLVVLSSFLLLFLALFLFGLIDF